MARRGLKRASPLRFVKWNLCLRRARFLDFSRDNIEHFLENRHEPDDDARREQGQNHRYDGQKDESDENLEWHFKLLVHFLLSVRKYETNFEKFHFRGGEN